MDYDTATTSAIAAAMAEELQRPADCLPVAADGAARAARTIAELL